jgi:hypothetical protein
MRSVLFLVIILVLSAPAVAQKLYKHVDEKGNVTYTDRPAKADQKPEKPKNPNVASPEARQQLQHAELERRREEALERQAQQRRYLSQQRREMEAEKARHAKEENPYSPEQQPALPRVRR